MKKQANTTNFFYQSGKLVTVNQGGQHRAIFRTADIPLAEQQTTGSNGLLVTDNKNSVISVQDDNEEENRSFSTYGHDPKISSRKTQLGFNGEHFEQATQHYLLGPKNHRPYNTILMRFQSPDNLSPFKEGGTNSYCYCLGDPINRVDPSGHASNFFVRVYKGVLNKLGARTPSRAATVSPDARRPRERANSTLSSQSYASIDSDTSWGSVDSNGYAASVSSIGSENSGKLVAPDTFHSVMTNQDMLQSVTVFLSGHDMFNLSIAYPSTGPVLMKISARNLSKLSASANIQFGNTHGIMRNVRAMHISTQRPESATERSVRMMDERVMRDLGT